VGEGVGEEEGGGRREEEEEGREQGKPFKEPSGASRVQVILLKSS
jgi:hypothetical protein